MAATQVPLKTVGEFAREHEVPEWKVRRLADAIGSVPRAGQYRLLTVELQEQIRERLEESGADCD